jgi:hypothetical protein
MQSEKAILLPARRLRAGVIVYRFRLHSRATDRVAPTWQGPYDLPHPRRTIYVALDIATVVEELFGPAAGRSRMITESQARRFSVVPLKLRRSFRLASVEHPKASVLGFEGPTDRRAGNEGHTTEWASQLAGAAFDGAIFRSRSAHSRNSTVAALFVEADPEDASPPMTVFGKPIDGISAAAAAGFTVEPWHLRSHLDLI